MEMQSGATIMKNSMTVLRGWFLTPLLNTYLRDGKPDLGEKSALSCYTLNNNQNVETTRRKMRKKKSIHALEYYSALKKEILTFAYGDKFHGRVSAAYTKPCV